MTKHLSGTGFLLWSVLVTATVNGQAPATAPVALKQRAVSETQIASVAFSPDGTKIAAGGYRMVTILETETGKTLAKLEGHAGAVTAVQFSPHGNTLAAAGGLPGKSGEVRLWDVSGVKSRGPAAVKQVPLVLDGPSDVVYAIAFSPDGTRLAGASYDRDVTLWSLPSASSKSKIQNPKSKILRDHTDAVYGVAFSRDGRLIASAAGDRTVKVWNAATGKRLYTLSESTAEVYAVAFSPNGTQVAAGGADKALRTWNIMPTGGTLAKVAFAHQGAILRVTYDRDGKTLFTSGEDNAVKRWNAATLAERMVYPKQPDWPQGIALSPDSRRLAVGRHNGSLAIYEVETGKLLREPLRGTPVVSTKPVQTPSTSSIPGRRLGDQRQRRAPGTGGATLFPASLANISPVGAARGAKVRFTLSGSRLNNADDVYFDDPAIQSTILTPPDKNAGLLQVEATLGANTRIGVHRVFVQTPQGTTGAVTFAVGGWPEVAQAEPNNSPETAQKLTFPCTVTGALDQPGDNDTFAFDAKAGEELVFEIVAQPIRSRLQPVLTLLDPAGKVLAESKAQVGRADTVLGYRFETAGRYVVQLRDYESAGGGDVYYRLNAGAFPYVTDVFPLGLQKGTTAQVQVKGFNLSTTTTRVTAPPDASWGRTIEMNMQTPLGSLVGSRRLAVGEDPEVMQAPGNSSLKTAQAVSTPVMINGKLWNRDGGVSQYYRFAAKKGQILLVDVQARRLGSPLDSEIEILDAQGRPVEKAVLRAVAQTEQTLNDRDSVSPGLRLLNWDGFRANDYFLAGREVIRLLELPKGPDEDLRFRSYRGQRIAYFGTTPEFHSVGAMVYKVEVHSPGSNFSTNGYPLTRLYHLNDDGGPLYGKDSKLEFTAPADGEYVVRIADTRGQQGEDYLYRLSIRPPRPDYRLVLSPEHPNLPKGGATPLTVECERYDGFDDAIEVRLEGLPAGFTATTTVIEPGEDSAVLLLSAVPEARTPSAPLFTKEGMGEVLHRADFRIAGRARIDGREVVHAIEPGNGVRLITVMADPDIRVATDRREVVIRPGEEVTIEAQVDRQGKFGARVPINVINLPYGVRVQNVGLNGVLVTEQDEARTFTIYCEPGVKPQTRAFYVVGVVEGGMSNGAPPLTLRIEPAQAKANTRTSAKEAPRRSGAQR